MENVSISDVYELPVEERIRLVQAIWESVASSPDQVPLPAAQVKKLDKCYSDYLSNPNSGVPWAEVKAKLLNEV